MEQSGNLGITMNVSGTTKCSFCGIEQDRTEKLLLGPGVAICDVCVEACRGPFDDDLHERLGLDPEQFSEAIAKNFKWGEINRGSAIRAKFCCEYCGRRLLRSLDDYYSWQIDHVIPNRDDSLEYCALACQTCNHLKHDYVPSGATREERVADARREVTKRRAAKRAELDKLRELLGLAPLVAA